MKRILINATQTEELRVAIVDIATQGLLDLLVERQSYVTKTGNIYMGKITAIEPSLDACFVNFGSERHGFLPFKEIAPNYFLSDISQSERPAIKDTLKEGQKVMIQVEKEERGNKGAALTTFISLAGSYLVLMPNNPRAGGISRRVEGGDRDELREILSNLPIPEEMGLIVRTAGVGKAITELQWDLNTLLRQWEAIQKATADRNPPFLIHQESDIVIRAIRDHLREDVSEIWVDDPSVFERIKNHLEQIRPDFVHCLKLYSSAIPLFNRYQIEHQIEAAHDREVRLPSGGSIVVGHTEALVAIDVNSGQATKGKDIEQTAFEINKEAARIIACQLRLRDIGGLVVIDFIDMPSVRHRREVESELRNALKLDKARTQVGSISPRFGLLEMSRQRLRHSLGEATRIVCPRCDGWGSIRSVESLALSILRMIEEDAIRPGTAQIQTHLPVEVATFIINEKRELIATIEKNQNIQILIIPNPKLESPHYRIKRLTESDITGTGKSGPSYRLVDTEEQDPIYKKGVQTKMVEEKPVVKGLFAEPAPTSQTKKPAASLVKRLISSLFGAQTEEPAKEPVVVTAPSSQVRHPHPPHRNQRNPERTPNRGSSMQPRRPRNAPPAGERNFKARTTPAVSNTAAASVPAAITAAPTTLPPASAGPQGSRSRRGTRGGNMQRRISSPTLQPPKVNLPITPDYPQPSFSDADLESYYQESAAFANKKSSKLEPTPALVNSSNNRVPKPETAAPTVTPSNPTPLPAIAVSTSSSEKAPAVQKPWTPHKIASATDPLPAVHSNSSSANETTTPAANHPSVAEKPANANAGASDRSSEEKV